MTSRRTRPSDTVRGHLYKWLALDLPTDARRDAGYPDELQSALPRDRVSKVVTEAERRLNLLFDHLGIPQGDYPQLAIALVCLHEPGLRVPRRCGRPPKARTPTTTQEIAKKLGVTGRPKVGRPRSVSPRELVRAVDTWQVKQKVLLGRRPTDAAWAEHALRSESEKKGLSGWKAKKYVEGHMQAKTKEISNARKWVRGWEASVRELMSEKLKRNS